MVVGEEGFISRIHVFSNTCKHLKNDSDYEKTTTTTD